MKNFVRQLKQIFKSIFNGAKITLFNFHGLSYFLTSVKAFCIDFIQSEKPLKRFKKRENGISVLLPTQNEEILVNLSVCSILDFADEIIIVDNGSIDKTKELVKNLTKNYSKIKFFDVPNLSDLYQNRNFALKQSRYRWICRFDSDFVAYTQGKNNILKLRNLLLNLPRGIIPKSISLFYINLGGDFWHSRIRDFLKHELKILAGPRISIYEYFPYLTFTRFGRREYATFQSYMNNITYKTVFWMHCDIKTGLNYFLRSERTNWRALGNYKKYPTLLSYIKSIIKEKYNTNNIKKALQIYLKNIHFDKNDYIKYDPKKYLLYPSLIQEEMKKKDVFRMKYF